MCNVSLDERQIKTLSNELSHLASMRNCSQCNNEKAFYKMYNATDAKLKEHYDHTERDTWDEYERYDDQLHANAQLLRRVFGIDVHWKSNAHGYITSIIVELSPHIGDTIEINVNLQHYILKWLADEEKRVYQKYFKCADYITDEITNGGY